MSSDLSLSQIKAARWAVFAIFLWHGILIGGWVPHIPLVKERIAACEKGGNRCSVTSFFDGLKYFEITQSEIKDVRLVYAPAEGIGVFGGETDNWRWPRQTERSASGPG